MCYYTEQRETTASVVVPPPGLQPALQPAGQSKTKFYAVVPQPGLQQVQPALQPADQTGQNPLQQLGKPTLLLYTNARPMRKQRCNLNFNL